MTQETFNKSIDEFLYGYVHIELFHLAVKHKIFQYLADHQSATTAEIAKALALDNDALGRILISLAGADILSHHHGLFTINEQYRHFFDCNDDGYIGNLIHFVRNQGRAALQQLEGRLTKQTLSRSPYDTLYDSTTDTTDFTQAMWELSYASGKALAALLVDELPPKCERIVDIGGGSGALAAGLIHASFTQKISVFDLPAVAADFDKKVTEHQLHSQIDFIAGDFFTDPLPDSNCYLLSYVLSNWDEQSIITLLQRIGPKLQKNNGKLIVLERLFETDGIKPFATAVMHLNMMLHTKGSHRTAEQYQQLFKAAGFAHLHIIKTPFDKQILITSNWS